MYKHTHTDISFSLLHLSLLSPLSSICNSGIETEMRMEMEFSFSRLTVSQFSCSKVVVGERERITRTIPFRLQTEKDGTSQQVGKNRVVKALLSSPSPDRDEVLRIMMMMREDQGRKERKKSRRKSEQLTSQIALFNQLLFQLFPRLPLPH